MPFAAYASRAFARTAITLAVAFALIIAFVVVVLVWLAGRESSSPLTLPTRTAPARIAEVTKAIDEINRTAGGPVAAQRAVLATIVDPDQAAKQRECPTATKTLAFDPAYRDLEPADDGDGYLLPTYITIYTGGHVTGSDLATLQWWFPGGVARSAALCVS